MNYRETGHIIGNPGKGIWSSVEPTGCPADPTESPGKSTGCLGWPTWSPGQATGSPRQLIGNPGEPDSKHELKW